MKIFFFFFWSPTVSLTSNDNYLESLTLHNYFNKKINPADPLNTALDQGGEERWCDVSTFNALLKDPGCVTNTTNISSNFTYN